MGSFLRGGNVKPSGWHLLAYPTWPPTPIHPAVLINLASKGETTSMAKKDEKGSKSKKDKKDDNSEETPEQRREREEEMGSVSIGADSTAGPGTQQAGEGTTTEGGGASGGTSGN